jgi:hypothetical protein
MKKTRNWEAVNAHFRRSGPMKDRKKEVNKRACRSKPEVECECCYGESWWPATCICDERNEE